MSETQEQGGAVQSAEEFTDRLTAHDTYEGVGYIEDLIRERDAAIRRAAIEECAAWLRGRQTVSGPWILSHIMVGELLAASGPPSERGEGSGEQEP